MIFESSAIRKIVETLPSLARSNVNVLILGESGTGKDLIARLLHELSPRAERKFVAVNCAAMPEALLESELFGHEKGAFTGANSKHIGLFEEADGGTLFLDEIGDMPNSIQAKLLRVLQDRTVRPVGSSRDRKMDFRLICATHQDLRSLIKTGTFRDDLYYRINVVPIYIPPLRERPEDIPPLAQHFLELGAIAVGTSAPKLTPDAIEFLKCCQWEGNVRELRNLIERTLALRQNQATIYADDLRAMDGSYSTKPPSSSPTRFCEHADSDGLMTVQQLVDQYISFVLDHVDHHQGKASKILGLSRRTLYRRLRSPESVLRH